jgi:glyoxylase-like metal-dependent hydrolase (beta-lactamase superfamily II)
MITINRFEHLDFTSNTYLIRHQLFNDNVYLIDAGNSQEVLDALKPNQKVKGIFLTHAHFDHICGLNNIIDRFPECIVYCSEYAHTGLLSEKLNLSFYHLEPIVFKGDNVSLIFEGMSIELFTNCHLKVLETTGHNKGSLSFIINDGIFTGDALIPGIPVVTKLKSGNKEDAKKSIQLIYQLLRPEQVIYPGHGPIFKNSEIDWSLFN